MTFSLHRSALYVPGSNARAIEKAKGLDADVVILDLEDAVAPDDKVRARAEVTAAVRHGGFGFRTVVIRLNHPSTAWARDDLLAAVEARPDAILLPKVEKPGDIMMVAADLASLGAPDELRIWAMVETARAVADCAALARTAADPASRLDVLVMGTNDLARETRVRVRPGRQALLPWLAGCVAAARCHGLDTIDGVYGRLDDLEGFRDECEQGRDFGFDGKTLIHPDQIADCNAAFSPSHDEIAWAQTVTEAFADPERARPGVMRLDGRMVERLHADMAQRTLALAAAIRHRNQGVVRDVGPGH